MTFRHTTSGAASISIRACTVRRVSLTGGRPSSGVSTYGETSNSPSATPGRRGCSSLRVRSRHMTYPPRLDRGKISGAAMRTQIDASSFRTTLRTTKITQLSQGMTTARVRETGRLAGA